MSDIKLTYIFFKSFEFIIFCIYGYILSKTKSNKEYWIKALVPIITYAIIEGLRFGRLIDWNIYYFRYNNLGQNMGLEDYEPLFELLCHTLYNLGVSYPSFIFISSLSLIISIFVLFKNYKNCLAYMLPITLFAISSAENFIRWYWGLVFLFLSLNSMINKRTYSTYLFFMLSVLFHMGIAVFLPIFIFAKYIDRINFNRTLCLGLFFATSFVLSLDAFSFLINIARFFLDLGLGSISPKIYNYLNYVEALIMGEFGRTGIMERSLMNNIRMFISYAPLIWFAQDAVKGHKYGNYFYNLFVIGAIVSPLFLLIEIFNRYASFMTFFHLIVGGVLFFFVFKNFFSIKRTVRYICLASFLVTIQPNVTSIFARDNDDEMLFVWNSSNRDFIPYWHNSEGLIKDLNR